MSCWIAFFAFFLLGVIVGLLVMGVIMSRVVVTSYRPCTDEPPAWYQPRVDPDQEPIDPSTLEDIPKFLRRQAE